MALDPPDQEVPHAGSSARSRCPRAKRRPGENGWRVVIAVVDDGGHAILLQRLDGAQWSSIETAVGKARAAVAWKRPTRLLEESVNNGRYRLPFDPQGMAILQGGVPIEIDGQVIGAIGVSGVKARRRRDRRPGRGARPEGRSRLAIPAPRTAK